MKKNCYPASVAVFVAALVLGNVLVTLPSALAAEGPNLVANPSLETAGTSGNPQGWNHGNWGTNTTQFTYPVAGIDGASAAKITMATFTDGDAKWYFDDVNVTPGAVYIFRDQYQATAPTRVTVRYTLQNNSFIYTDIGLPVATPDATWQTAQFTFTPPANAVKATLFHHIHAVGSLSIDAVSVALQNAGGGGDAVPPTISLMAPANGATASGTLLVTADASDNVGVLGVQFLLNGVNLDAEDTSAPYGAPWDTMTVQNGVHELTARARDAAGNTALSSVATVQVANGTGGGGGNLIPNPSLETAGTSGNPQGWNRGNWGTNTAVFTYPVAGIHGAAAAKVAVTSYTDGDAKWYFSDISVTPGTSYTFSNQYLSTAPTALVIRYTLNTGAVTYADMGTLPSSGGAWQTLTRTITPPQGVTSLTVFHLLRSVGELIVDNFSLSTGSGGGTGTSTDTFATGMVSLTFDDGWTTQYDSALPLLNIAGMKGTFYIITGTTIGAGNPNRIQNAGFETAGTNGNPANWNHGNWGTNTTQFIYPAAGFESAKGAKVAITSYTNGDAKWYFNDVDVVPGERYSFHDMYKATVPSAVTIQYTLADNTFQYVDLGTFPASANWQSIEMTFTAPANAVKVSMFHFIQTVGELTIDNVSLVQPTDYIGSAQMLEFQSFGHEITAHTRTHTVLTTVHGAQLQSEVQGSRDDMLAAGASPVSTFAYPEGEYNAEVQTATANAGFSFGRSTDTGFNVKSTDKYALKVQNVLVGTSLATIQSWIDSAAASKTWLILVFHQIDHSGAQFGTTPEILKGTLDYIPTKHVSVKTMAEMIPLMNP